MVFERGWPGGGGGYSSLKRELKREVSYTCKGERASVVTAESNYLFCTRKVNFVEGWSACKCIQFSNIFKHSRTQELEEGAFYKKGGL